MPAVDHARGEFMRRRLAQLEPLGARLGVQFTHATFWVSTVKFVGKRWTRVEDNEGNIITHLDDNGRSDCYQAVRQALKLKQEANQ